MSCRGAKLAIPDPLQSAETTLVAIVGGQSPAAGGVTVGVSTVIFVPPTSSILSVELVAPVMETPFRNCSPVSAAKVASGAYVESLRQVARAPVVPPLVAM